MSFPFIDKLFLPGTVVTSAWLNGINDSVKNAIANTNLTFNTTSIANLKLVDKTTHNYSFNQGYTSPGTGSGAYWYDSSDTTSVDNGGSIIVANDGARWKLLDGLIPLLTQFGGVGDGVTDNATAIAKIAAAKKGPFAIPPGGLWKSGSTTLFKQGLNFYDFQPATYADSYNSIDILRETHAQGGITQVCGLRLTDSIGSDCTHQEVGIFSILNVLGNTQHHVGMYSQVNVSGAANAFYYGGCMEVGNVQIDGSGSSVNQALVGLEIDMKSKYAYDGTDPVPTRKTAYSAVAWGGGTIHEAYSVYSSGALNGNGTYQTGDFLYGLKMRTNSINNASGIGIMIDSDHAQGININGKSIAYGINLQGAASGGNVGINVGSGYSVGIAVQQNQGIKFNGAGNVQQIYFNPTLTSLTLSCAQIGVENHTVFTTATAGPNGATPANVRGFLSVYVNGTLRKVPFYD